MRDKTQRHSWIYTYVNADIWWGKFALSSKFSSAKNTANSFTDFE